MKLEKYLIQCLSLFWNFNSTKRYTKYLLVCMKWCTCIYIQCILNNIKSKLTIAFCFYITMSFDLFSKNKYSYICTTKHAITKIAFWNEFHMSSITLLSVNIWYIYLHMFWNVEKWCKIFDHLKYSMYNIYRKLN